MKFKRHINSTLILLNIVGIFSFLSSSCDKQPQKMKTISYRGRVVEFRIPSSWKEEYSDIDGGTFYGDKPDSGTFRLKIITLGNIDH